MKDLILLFVLAVLIFGFLSTFQIPEKPNPHILERLNKEIRSWNRLFHLSKMRENGKAVGE
jgi:hypothetical protein